MTPPPSAGRPYCWDLAVSTKSFLPSRIAQDRFGTSVQSRVAPSPPIAYNGLPARLSAISTRVPCTREGLVSPVCGFPSVRRVYTDSEIARGSSVRRTLARPRAITDPPHVPVADTKLSIQKENQRDQASAEALALRSNPLNPSICLAWRRPRRDELEMTKPAAKIGWSCRGVPWVSKPAPCSPWCSALSLSLGMA
jgi:hypothetical protein